MKHDMVKKAGIYFSCVIVTPFLAILSVCLVLIGVLFPIGMMLESFGVIGAIMRAFHMTTEMQFNVGPFVVPSFLRVPVAIVVGIALAFAGAKLFGVLKRYLRYLRAV